MNAVKSDVLYGKLTEDNQTDIIVTKQLHTTTKPTRLHFHTALRT